MSGPVDVLAVIRSAANANAPNVNFNLLVAADAVAELIEADMALDSANHALTMTDPQSEDAETMEAMRSHRNRMIARRRKALAACGGAP